MALDKAGYAPDRGPGEGNRCETSMVRVEKETCTFPERSNSFLSDHRSEAINDAIVVGPRSLHSELHRIRWQSGIDKTDRAEHAGESILDVKHTALRCPSLDAEGVVK